MAGKCFAPEKLLNLNKSNSVVVNTFSEFVETYILSLAIQFRAELKK